MAQPARPNHCNDIDFQILAANAVSNFRSNQAKSLGEIRRLEVRFDSACEDALLIEYERAVALVANLERCCFKAFQQADHSTLTTDIQVSFTSFFKSTEMCSREGASSTIRPFLRIVHETARETIAKLVSTLAKNEPPSTAFFVATGIAQDYCDHVMLCLHELNNLRNNRTPTICLSDFDFKGTAGLTGPRKRQSYYAEHYHLNTFEIADYTLKTAPSDVEVAMASMGAVAHETSL